MPKKGEKAGRRSALNWQGRPEGKEEGRKEYPLRYCSGGRGGGSYEETKWSKGKGGGPQSAYEPAGAKKESSQYPPLRESTRGLKGYSRGLVESPSLSLRMGREEEASLSV